MTELADSGTASLRGLVDAYETWIDHGEVTISVASACTPRRRVATWRRP